uniref:Methyltransf_21 domain-containing protein n=1 Tax=Caenorhabditis japonica TaxID=281687 RepID=A0A8R1HGG9_CAEJA
MSLREGPFNVIFICLLVFVIVFVFVKEPSVTTEIIGELQTNASGFQKWSLCMKEKVTETNHLAFWAKFQQWTDECDKLANIDNLGLVSLKNHDEMKYGILPVKEDQGSDNVLVTLGIGKDIDAEVQYKNKMNEIGRNLTFYGADPITDVNADLYSTIGKYFPFAIGGDAGYSTASVYVNGIYKNQDVVHVDLVYFFNRILKIKTYDNIWLDAESAEYGLFDIFYKTGPLDKRGIRFCQMSLEVHLPDDNKKIQFMNFIKTVISENRYGMHKNRNVGHMRMYLFNYEDTYCQRKFLPKSWYATD